MTGKFTIQQMLWATLAFGFVAMAMTAAYRGNFVAFGVLVAPLFMTITFAVLAVVYWISFFVCRLLNPLIHTPAPADFSAAPIPQKQLADSRYSNPDAAETNGTQGESE